MSLPKIEHPPFALVARLYREARRATPCHGGQHSGDDILGRQPYLRRVSEESHRRMRAAGIYVVVGERVAALVDEAYRTGRMGRLALSAGDDASASEVES